MKYLLTVVLAIASVAHSQSLLTVELPAGEVAPFDVGFSGWNGTNRTKYPNPRDDGYDGIRFVGAGRNATHILPIVTTSEGVVVTTGDSTVFVGRGCGVVAFEHLTLHTAARKGIHVGGVWDGESELDPSTLRLRDVTVITDPPAPGLPHTSVWGMMGYNTDADFDGVRLELAYTAEHAFYWHGFWKRGIRWHDVDVVAVGAEGMKVATRPEEVAFVPEAQIIVQDCFFGNWAQPWSWRGGGGIVLQGSGATRILIERTRFRGGGLGRGRCLMIDDGGVTNLPGGEILPRFYDVFTGAVTGSGHANGDVIVRRSGASAGPGPSTYREMIRMGTIAPPGQTPIVARSVKLMGSGFYGQFRIVGISGISGDVTVEGCNSDRIEEVAASRAVPVEYPAVLNVERGGFRSIEEGY